MTTTTLVDTSFIESTHQSIKLSEPPPAARPAQPARLDASKLEIVRTTAPRELPCFAQLEFGRTVTDHMLQVQWTALQGWSVPKIVPYQQISLDPSAGALHYAFECFEGMKAYRDAHDVLRLFRPDKNMQRLNGSAERIALPTFDQEELIKLIAKFVALEERFIPRQRGYSLYLRPVIIGTSGGLAVNPPTSALLYMIASPVGNYYSQGFRAISVEAMSSSTAARAWPGGVGNRKVGSNYAPCMVPSLAAGSRGYHQVLWLFGEEDYVTEAGTMNFFIVLRHRAEGTMELVTAPLDGTILAGVTRDCVLDLAREKLKPQGWLISERRFTMTEVAAAADAGELIEAFGTGTAAIVSPIRHISWRKRIVNCGLDANQEAGEMASLVKLWIERRQYGEEEHDWSVLVEGCKQL